MENKIAITGLGALFPGAHNIPEFWQNILSKKVSIQPLPEEMFESQVFYRPELLTAFTKEDKSVTKIAGWIENLSFDSVKKYKIPPSVAEHMDSNQHAALYTVGQALEQDPLRGVANERVAVIFGNGMVGTRYGDAMFRVEFQLMEHYLGQHPAFLKLSPTEQSELLEHLRANLLKDTIPISEDSAPGVLPNLIAGRIANVFDFHGPSFTVDAACASVLAAVITGIQGLQLKQYDAVVCGGSDMPLKQLGFVLFSALNALSPNGSYPFDQRADGFVMGQGAGTVILKRLQDAIQSQDPIYAVISGYGQASDGKGKYIAAPNAEWQARVIEDACRMAGYPVDTIEMIEAHGTATKVGDVVEVEGLKQAFSRLGASRVNYCGLTSVKSNIGHLKSAAGIAGLIKAVLAIHHQVLPPTASFETINPKLSLEGSPFYILQEVRDWQANPAHPRRANVSAFGFGGADYHLALEEYRAEDYRSPVFTGFQAQSASQTRAPSPQAAAISSLPTPSEIPQVVTFYSPTAAGLQAPLQAFLDNLEQHPELTFSELCRLHNHTIQPGPGARLALLAHTPGELAEKAHFFAQNWDQFDDELFKSSHKAKGIYFKEGPVISPAETAIMFPGQASQYLNMFQGAFQAFDSLRAWFYKADAYWFARYGTTVSALIYPTGLREEEALEKLRQTQHAHPTIFTASYALYELLRQAGLQADFMIGHSLGEITALAAARKLSFQDALRLVEQRGMAFYHADLEDPGQMLSLVADQSAAEQLIQQSGCAVSVANLNSPRQTIVAGASAQIQRFTAYLDEQKIPYKALFVSHAFHTPLLTSVAERFYSQIQDLTFQASPVRVMMNHTSEFYPDEPQASGSQDLAAQNLGAQNFGSIPALLREQILQPVNFVAGIQRLYQHGVRLFVEVGPGSILSSQVKEILSDQSRYATVSVLTANFKNAPDLVSLQKLCAALFCEGVALQPLAFPQALPGMTGAPASPQPPRQETTPAAEAATLQAPLKVVYSGAAIGLPGSYKDSFRDDNFEQLFAGRNLIERLSDAERQALVDLQISKLIKNESGPTFKLLTALEDVIQLAGKIGRLDLISDYHIDEKLVQNMTSCIAHGVAAGYEALRDAHIPLVREYSQTTTGKWLPQKLALPPALQDETGVIFANGFPLIDPVIQEVSRYLSYKLGSKTRKELMAFYESLIGCVKDETARKLLTDWYTLYYTRLSDQPGQEEVFRFNHHFMTQISAQANNLLAFLLNARGPNFQLNAACSSTSNAITIAEDFIRTGRVQRMIVVGADDASSPTNFPLLGAGFLCTGAATNEGDLYQAAIPFDRRRNGMIVGAGAVGLVLETEAAAEQRGIRPICELLGTHSFNTARHISQIDAEIFASQMEQFIGRMEGQYGLQRAELARQVVYISHETYTPPRGGCSQTEVVALQHAFGEHFRHIIVGNTKGMTGHTMGGSLEDAVAAKSLQYGKCPPVVNYAQPDPALEGLQLWQGGRHERQFALKMSAGFGAQGHFALLRKTCTGDDRIADPARYQTWLQQASADPLAATELRGRVLTVIDRRANPGETPAHETDLSSSRSPQAGALAPVGSLERGQATTPSAVRQTTLVGSAAQDRPIQALEIAHALGDRRQVAAQAVERMAQVTGYPPEMLEPEMEFEADLGINSERLEMLRTSLAQHFALSLERLQIEEKMTVGEVIERIYQALQGQQPPAGLPQAHPAASQPAGDPLRQTLIADTLKVFAEVTKYPQEMLELDMEMEADLGIDTVKQATILALLGEKYQLERDETIQLSNYPTIRSLIELVYQRSPLIAASLQKTAPAPAPGQAASPRLQASADMQTLIEDTLEIFAQVTKYPQEMLELDMEMEADLGIDTVKQATILALLGEKYQLERDETIQLSNYPTIRSLIELVASRSDATLQAKQSPAPAMQPERQQSYTTGSASPADVSLDTPTAGNFPAPAWHSELSRQVPYLAEEPLGPRNFDLADQQVWIVSDAGVPVEPVVQLAAQKGAGVRVLIFPRHAQVEQLEQVVANFIQENTPDLIIDCTHLGEVVDFPQLDPLEAQDLLLRCSTARFILYKQLSQQEKLPRQVICLTAGDGAFGLAEGGPRLTDPSFGALSGFYKGLRKEFAQSAHCSVRILDLAEPLASGSLQAAAEMTLSELEHNSLGVEIAYLEGKRHIVKLRDEDHLLSSQPIRQLSFSATDTFLISGGGSGISAQIAQALAQELPVNFIILDVVPLPENIAELAGLDENGLEQLRQQMHARLQQENSRVTPALLNREFSQVTRAVEIYRNLQALEQMQRRVVYIACDVRDLELLRSELQRARQKIGPISAILHAAGLDRSHLLGQKSLDEFQQVFSVKAQGALNLMLLCQEDPLRLVVAFSSISGRFGNAAQLDYCAANNFLNDWIKMMKYARPDLHAISLAWSGWKDVGIAWRNEFVRQRAEETGLNFIEIEQGIAAFMNEIHQPTSACEILLHKGLNGFIEPGLADVYLPDFPLIDRLTLREGAADGRAADGRAAVRAYRQFSVRRDGLIDQHRLGKTPILPAVAYSELAAEYYALQSGKQGHYLLRQVNFSNAFKLFHEQPRELFVEGQPGDYPGAWKIEIKSSFKPAHSAAAQVIVHSQAIVSSEAPDLSGLDPQTWSYQLDQPDSLPAEESLGLIQNQGPEQRIILGVLFNDVLREAQDKAPVLIYPQGTTYPAYFPLEQLDHPKYPLEKLLVNPCFLDSLYQACAANLLVKRKRVYLPWEVAELGVLQVPRQPGLYTCYAQIVEDDQQNVSFDVVMQDEMGAICYYMRHARFRMINL